MSDPAASDPLPQGPLRRISVIGNAGSGKTRLARLLGGRLGLPVIHLDRHFFLPGWVARPEPDWAAVVARFAGAESWVIDGNHITYFGARHQRADLILWLDTPVWLSLWRVIRRLVTHYGKVRGDDLPPGCPERFDWEFLVFVATYRQRRGEIASAMEGAQGAVIRLRTKREIAAFLKSLPGD
ncbi:MAG: adenylate kinase [Pseudomonadota bacterium]